MEAGRNVKERGLDNNLLELIAGGPFFNLSLGDLKKSNESGDNMWAALRPRSPFI